MTRFEPVTTTTPLPPPGSGAEHALWDLKKGISGKEFHNAKDIAAFANHLGGTLLVGVQEDGTGQVATYWPMTAAEVERAETQMARAVENRCRPRPVVNYARIPVAGGFVLAVNVWPFISAAVGVAVNADRADGFGGTAYVFPIRLTNQTTWISSDNLPMHMLPELRRKLILLAGIPTGAPIRLVKRGHNAEQLYTLESIDEITNTVRFRTHPHARPQDERWEPLDCVLHVHQSYKRGLDEATMWQIGLADPY